MNVEAQRQLILASDRGDLALVRDLVGQGVDPNAQIPGYMAGQTLLMAAAEEGREDVTQFLLSLPNINPNARDVDSWTALSLASLYGHLNIVKLLLDHGADPEAVTDSGRTVLDLVARAVIHWGIVERRDRTREVLRHLVLEVGLPVTDKVRREAAGDAGSLAICEQGRAEVRSLKKLARRAVWMLPREVRVREELPVTVQQFVNS